MLARLYVDAGGRTQCAIVPGTGPRLTRGTDLLLGLTFDRVVAVVVVQVLDEPRRRTHASDTLLAAR